MACSGNRKTVKPQKWVPMVKRSNRKRLPWTAYAVKDGVKDVLNYFSLKRDAVAEAKIFCEIENRHERDVH